jgi:hypothetical protein
MWGGGSNIEQNKNTVRYETYCREEIRFNLILVFHQAKEDYQMQWPICLLVPFEVIVLCSLRYCMEGDSLC